MHPHRGLYSPVPAPVLEAAVSKAQALPLEPLHSAREAVAAAESLLGIIAHAQTAPHEALLAQDAHRRFRVPAWRRTHARQSKVSLRIAH